MVVCVCVCERERGCIKCMGRACDRNVALTEAIQTKVANNMSASS